jgi:hypothetical protein
MGGGVAWLSHASLFPDAGHDIEEYNSLTIPGGARTPADMIYKIRLTEWRKTPKVNFCLSVDKVRRRDRGD